jgi:hypothetical protein
MDVVRCPVCAQELSAVGRFCHACGFALTGHHLQATGSYAPATVAAQDDPPPTAAVQRLPPGRLLAGRYRIVSRIGRGGMGEVYCTEDLRLGGQVALKFLPTFLITDADRLRRLRNEVRVARQVTHANVCRVFDIAEADAAHGRPVFFFVSTPGRENPRLGGVGGQRNQQFRTAFEFALPMLIVAVGGVLAYHNLRRGRVDVRGCRRLGVFVFAVTFAAWLTRAHHAAVADLEYGLFMTALGKSLCATGVLFVAYAAVEPYVRRRWPWRIVSWNRLLAGRFTDPLVGRDLLLGCLLGAIEALNNSLEGVACEVLSLPSDIYFPRIDLDALSLTRLPHFLLHAQLDNALGGLIGFASFFLLFLLFRREWLAGVAIAAVWVVVFLSGPDYVHPVNAAFVIIRTALVVYFALRFGLLVTVAFGFVWAVLALGPLTYDLNTWHAASTVTSVALVVALAGYGFWVAKAGRPLFAAAWLEREMEAAPAKGEHSSSAGAAGS